MIFRSISSCLAVFIFAAIGFGQFQSTVLSTDLGLPVNNVVSILQTSDGYLWVTTSDGLARYNGARFTVFNKANTPGINGNRFTALFEDRNRTLWIGTGETGLVKYENGHFQTYDTANGLPGNWVVDIQEDLEGNLFVLTTRGVARRQDERFVPYTPYDESRPLISLRLDRSGGVWTSDSAGFHRYGPDGEVADYRIPGAQAALELLTLYDDRNGTYWLSATARDAGSFGLIRISNQSLTGTFGSTPDQEGSVGQYTSISVGADGMPLMSYWDETNNQLKVARCTNIQCSSFTVTAVDSTGAVGKFGSLAIGANGMPVISYWDEGRAQLKIAHCSNAQCLPYHRRR